MSKNALPVTVMIRGPVIFNFSARSHAKRELCVRPTENTFAKLTPVFVWFAGISATTIPGLSPVAS